MTEERTSRIEKKVDRIESDLSEIKTVVGRIETKLDERAKATEQKFEDQGKRIDRLGFRFWSMIAGLGIIVVGYVVKNV